MRGSFVKIALAASTAVILAGCSSKEASPQTGGFRTGEIESGGIGFGFGGGKKNKGGDSTIGVNSFLWRATLDTVNFMPLTSADPFGGVIITDWYSNPQTPNERFKLTI